MKRECFVWVEKGELWMVKMWRLMGGKGGN